ncbi:hypothetical protein [Pseudoxanthomonas yeongjuensis]|jgi:hypothetical protein|uniref:hypothetical protein n=1 Tax=Pseudoxanthomonas yeongjuensis TaxID=377616 RepID=UPI001391BB86|nr:hypothetical protein [Pseudoxanthomonas yeongjuensis]
MNDRASSLLLNTLIAMKEHSQAKPVEKNKATNKMSRASSGRPCVGRSWSVWDAANPHNAKKAILKLIQNAFQERCAAQVAIQKYTVKAKEIMKIENSALIDVYA